MALALCKRTRASAVHSNVEDPPQGWGVGNRQVCRKDYFAADVIRILIESIDLLYVGGNRTRERSGSTCPAVGFPETSTR